MILSMHQPNFIPWVGFFNKIWHSDVIVILDHVQYPRGKSIANRNKIKAGKGELELVVPISVPKGNEGKELYPNVNFGDDKWVTKSLKTIAMSYSKAPYYEEYIDHITRIFGKDNFCEMNIEFINFVVDNLGIETKVVKLSELDGNFEQKNDLILGLCHHFEADTYLSGHGASKYNDLDYLKEKGVDLIYQNYTAKTYQQVKGEFIPNLSIIDLLFNRGKDSLEIVKG